MHQTNLEVTANITNVCLKHKIEKLIHISSIAAIGKETGKTVLHEDSKWENEDLQSAYGLSKYRSELEVWRAQAEGLDVAVLCPSVILGPGVWHKSSTQIFDYVRKGKKFYTYGRLNYVDVRDVAEVVYLTMTQPISGKYILNGGVILV